MNHGPQFLGIGAPKAATTWLEHCLRRDILGRRVHSGGEDREIPLELARELARFHLDTIRELESRFGGHAVAWRERAERLIAG